MQGPPLSRPWQGPGGPRRAQEGQEWRQDGPGKGPGRQRPGPGGRPEGTGMPSRSRDGTLGFGAPSLLRIFDFFVGFLCFFSGFSFCLFSWLFVLFSHLWGLHFIGVGNPY